MGCIKNLRGLCVIVSLLFFSISCSWHPNTKQVYSDSNCWMKNISDNVLLKELTIPGTHDTCALYDFMIAGSSSAQDMNLIDQLDSGIRFLDIRLHKNNDGTIYVYHGIKCMYITFKDVVDICYNFLDKNRTECIIMMVKEEVFRSSGTGEMFASDIDKIINKTPNKWYQSTSFPNTLGDARGKIILVRNFLGSDKGVNIYNGNSEWERKGDSASVPSNSVKTIEDKWNQVSSYIDLKASDSYTPTKMCMHSVAAYNALVAGLPNIDNVAKVINPRLEKKLRPYESSNKHLGILMCDKVYPKLIHAIYKVNY